MLTTDRDMQALLLHASATTRARSEMELRQAIAQALRACAIAVEEQYVCDAGAADLVTARRDVVIEVKLELSRKQVYTALGQVLICRQAINPLARAIVVGYATEETPGLVDWAAEIGVEVVRWRTEGEGPNSRILSQP
jgi:hypothetical protein